MLFWQCFCNNYLRLNFVLRVGIKSKASDILDNVSKVIVGKRNVSELVLTSIIAGGHVLLDDVPGTG